MAGLRAFIERIGAAKDHPGFISDYESEIVGNPERVQAKLREMGYADVQEQNVVAITGSRQAEAVSGRRRIIGNRQRLDLPPSMLRIENPIPSNSTTIKQRHDPISDPCHAMQEVLQEKQKNAQSSYAGYDCFDTDAEDLDATITLSDLAGFEDPWPSDVKGLGHLNNDMGHSKVHKVNLLPAMEQGHDGYNTNPDGTDLDGSIVGGEDYEHDGSGLVDNEEEQPEMEDQDIYHTKHLVVHGLAPQPDSAAYPQYQQDRYAIIREGAIQPLTDLRSKTSLKHEIPTLGRSTELPQWTCITSSSKAAENLPRPQEQSVKRKNQAATTQQHQTNRRLTPDQTIKAAADQITTIGHRPATVTLPKSCEPTENNYLGDKVHVPGSDGQILPSQTRMRDLKLDHDTDELSGMTYHQLSTEDFDEDPDGAGAVVPKDVANHSLPQQLQFMHNLRGHGEQESQRKLYFSSLPIEQYEECGKVIVERFCDIMKRYMEARQHKRNVAREFEAEIATREKRIRGKKNALESDLSQLRRAGEDVVRGNRV